MNSRVCFQAGLETRFRSRQRVAASARRKTSLLANWKRSVKFLVTHCRPPEGRLTKHHPIGFLEGAVLDMAEAPPRPSLPNARPVHLQRRIGQPATPSDLGGSSLPGGGGTPGGAPGGPGSGGLGGAGTSQAPDALLCPAPRSSPSSPRAPPSSPSSRPPREQVAAGSQGILRAAPRE